MKKLLLVLVILLCFGTLVYSQNTRYVAVQSTDLKSSNGFFANNLRTLSLGDTVTLVSESGKWSQVQAGNVTGWVQSSNLSSRRIVSSGSTSISANEVALAGKGFSPETELEYKRNGLDYSMVDAMERITIQPNDLLRFITDGNLARGE